MSCVPLESSRNSCVNSPGCVSPPAGLQPPEAELKHLRDACAHSTSQRCVQWRSIDCWQASCMCFYIDCGANWSKGRRNHNPAMHPTALQSGVWCRTHTSRLSYSCLLFLMLWGAVQVLDVSCPNCTRQLLPVALTRQFRSRRMAGVLSHCSYNCSIHSKV